MSANKGAKGNAATNNVMNPYWIASSRYSSNNPSREKSPEKKKKSLCVIRENIIIVICVGTMILFTYQDCNHAPIESKPFCLYHLHLRSASLKCKNATSFADIYKIMPRIADVYKTLTKYIVFI